MGLAQAAAAGRTKVENTMKSRVRCWRAASSESDHGARASSSSWTGALPLSLQDVVSFGDCLDLPVAIRDRHGSGGGDPLAGQSPDRILRAASLVARQPQGAETCQDERGKQRRHFLTLSPELPPLSPELPALLQKLWPLYVDYPDGLSWRNDGNALILPSQGKQMPVSGDDQLGFASEGASEHMIIIGIVFDDAGHLGGRHHRHQGAVADSQC